MTAKEQISEHKEKVRLWMFKISDKLQYRGFHHDDSKLGDIEYPYFEKAIPILSEAEYLSEKYKEGIELLRPALKHHYENNSHHPEYYKKFVCSKCGTEHGELEKDGCAVCGGKQLLEKADITQMSLLDLIEMIVDWKAATEMTKNGDIMKSLELNQKRFGYSDELKYILRNTIKEFE